MIALQVLVSVFFLAGTLGGFLYLTGIVTGVAGGLGSVVAARVTAGRGSRGRRRADTKPDDDSRALPL